MQKKLYSLLLVVGLMFVLPLSIAAVGTTNVDVDSPFVDCNYMSLTDSPSGVNGDAIATSITGDEGSYCYLSNDTDNSYDVALQYRSGIEYGSVTAIRYRYEYLSITNHDLVIGINQNDLLRRLVTTASLRLDPGDELFIAENEGKFNIEGFVVRKR